MQIEPWTVPLIVMMLVVLPPSLMWFVGWVRRVSSPDTPSEPEPARGPRDARREQIWMRVLALLTLGLLCLAVLAIGPTAANAIAAAASAVSTVVSAALTVQSFLTLQQIRAEQAARNGDGSSGGAAPAEDGSDNRQGATS